MPCLSGFREIAIARNVKTAEVRKKIRKSRDCGLRIKKTFRTFAAVITILMCIIMATANRAIPTQPGRLTVDFEDISMLRDIKKAISMVRGVTKVTVPRRQRMSSYERSLRDLDEGRVYEYDSLDDLIKEIETRPYSPKHRYALRLVQ